MLAKFCTFLQRSMTSYPKETFRKKLQNVTLCTLGTRSLIKPYPSGLELSGSPICIKVFSKLISFFKRKVHTVISSWKDEINYNFCLTVLMNYEILFPPLIVTKFCSNPSCPIIKFWVINRWMHKLSQAKPTKALF